MSQHQCNRCSTIVDTSPKAVSEGYFAYCPYHDEDLFEIECSPVESKQPTTQDHIYHAKKVQ